MAIRQIRVIGDEILTKPCKPVKEMNDRTRELIGDMFETMYASNGCGLAAPQVGIRKRLVVIDVDDENQYVLINPEILETSGSQTGPEGCLSVPGKQGQVTRADHVKVRALNEDMELDVDGMRTFLEAHKDETLFMFGFTFMIWQHFYKKLLECGYRPDLSRGILIHGGGWKKLVTEKVSPEAYKSALHEVCGIMPENVHDYYGMVEQTGTIYMECECGHLHTSCFSDVLVRRPKDFTLADMGEKGLIEVVSVLPQSYPGHILLTEDEGVILGEDDCPCGRKGKYFKIEGRIKNAEIRGCSDTYAAKF